MKKFLTNVCLGLGLMSFAVNCNVECMNAENAYTPMTKAEAKKLLMSSIENGLVSEPESERPQIRTQAEQICNDILNATFIPDSIKPYEFKKLVATLAEIGERQGVNPGVLSSLYMIDFN